MVTPTTRRLLFKVLPYPIIFMLAGLLYVNVEYGLLEDATHYPESMTLYNPINSLISILIMNCLLGLVLGILEELIFKNRFKQRSFTIKILAKTLLYIFIFLTTVMVFSFLLNAANSGGSITSKEVYLPTIEFFMSFGLVSIVVFAGFIIALSLFFSEIVDYLGLDIVGNFFSGKYSKPVIENRIFMFLDMKDSTTIAEKIGHQKQYRLLNDYYREMTAAIVQTEGAIYQYVGDEIIVSWSREQGLEQSNCLQCFFLIEKSIAARSQHFLDHYGVVPGFKAGLHLGEVTRGQVGQIKRDLLYTGDVLNATARIQGLCNKVGERLLISSELKKVLPAHPFQFVSKGEFELRGRQQKAEIFTVSEA